MKTIRTIAVIGGTGKSGRYLVQQLLQRNYSIRLLLRQEHIIDPKITPIWGDASNPSAVQMLVNGADALISTIGQQGNERPVFSAATANVIRSGVQRYIVTTGLSVNTLADQKSPWVMQATDWMYQHYPQTTHDKQREYELLEKSGLDWTLVRLPMIALNKEALYPGLIDSPGNEAPAVTANLIDCPGNKINATSLAKFLVDQLNDPTFIHAAPFIANAE